MNRQLTFNNDWFVPALDRTHAVLSRDEMRAAKITALTSENDGWLVRRNVKPCLVVLFSDGSRIEFYARRMVIVSAQHTTVAQYDCA